MLDNRAQFAAMLASAQSIPAPRASIALPCPSTPSPVAASVPLSTSTSSTRPSTVVAVAACAVATAPEVRALMFDRSLQHRELVGRGVEQASVEVRGGQTEPGDGGAHYRARCRAVPARARGPRPLRRAPARHADGPDAGRAARDALGAPEREPLRPPRGEAWGA